MLRSALLRGVLAGAGLFLLALLLPACQTLNDKAPPVNASIRGLGSNHGIDPAVLERGRQTYVNTCATCHALPAIGSYSAQHWQGTLSRMTPRAKLTPRQTDDLTAYVLTARQAQQ